MLQPCSLQLVLGGVGYVSSPYTVKVGLSSGLVFNEPGGLVPRLVENSVLHYVSFVKSFATYFYKKIGHHFHDSL